MNLRRLRNLGIHSAVVLCLVVALNRTQSTLTTMRAEQGLTDVDPLTNAPPLVAFTTTALGGFRGLFADLLWLRMIRLQEQGDYFEMVQLASWVVKLQPRFTGAIAHLAWNMSYNLSVTYSDYADRWRWVRNGIRVIQEEGLLYNPGDPDLYYELGWIYQHKIGDDLDDANRYYKTEMAREMMRVFGGYPPNWDVLVEAPQDVSELRDRLGEGSVFLAELARRGVSLSEFEQRFREQGAFPQDWSEAEIPDVERALVEGFLRAKWLRLEYRMDPEYMAQLNVRFGQLDWRLPQAYALYWASRGLESADRSVHTKCERMITQSLTQAFKEGRLLYVDGEGFENTHFTPNLEVADAARAAYESAIQKHEGNIGFRAGYENLLIDAIVTFYVYGREQKAREYLRIAREEFGGDKYAKPLERFALQFLAEDIADMTREQVQGTVQAYLYRTCIALAYGDLERAAGLEALAGTIYEKYMAEHRRSQSQSDRTGLPPYAQMKVRMVRRCLGEFPPVLATRLRSMLGQIQAEDAAASESPRDEVPR